MPNVTAESIEVAAAATPAAATASPPSTPPCLLACLAAHPAQARPPTPSASAPAQPDKGGCMMRRTCGRVLKLRWIPARHAASAGTQVVEARSPTQAETQAHTRRTCGGAMVIPSTGRTTRPNFRICSTRPRTAKAGQSQGRQATMKAEATRRTTGLSGNSKSVRRATGSREAGVCNCNAAAASQPRT